MYEDLKIIEYPDPRLKKTSSPVEKFDADLAELARRMFELMRESRGVGLAAPQVGHNIRLFVMNHTGDPKDDRVYVNPEFGEVEGSEEAEEGCLSLPNINGIIQRDKTVHMRARDLAGNVIEQTETGYIARIWQHETDHLNGTLIIDRMSTVGKMAVRKALRELEENYAAAQGKPKPKKKLM